MKPLPCNSDLLRVAPRVVWFEPAERALAEPVRFLAYVMTYVMTYATAEEIGVVRRYVDLDDFREALENAPPGHHGRAILGLLERDDGAISRTANAPPPDSIGRAWWPVPVRHIALHGRRHVCAG
jgi:hypothetical protein